MRQALELPIVRERRAVTADTAMRLARYFGGDARSWLSLQAAYDLRVAEIRNAKRIKREIAAAAAWLMTQKKRFLINQAIATSIIAAFQHAGVYAAGLKANDPRKKSLREELAERLRSLGEKYHEPVTGEEHCRNIEEFANILTEKYKRVGLLRKERFRIGVAQKALNLYLKNLWCLEIIPPPPPCPLDRQIIDKLGLKSSERSEYNWTKLDKIERYRELISLCDKAAREKKSQSIAEWELEVYEGSIRDLPHVE